MCGANNINWLIFMIKHEKWYDYHDRILFWLTTILEAACVAVVE